MSKVPALNGLFETSLYVADPDRSARFYESLCGFSEVDRSDRLIALAVADRQLLLLFKKGASIKSPYPAHDGQGELHLAFAIPATDLAAWETRLREHGVAVVERRQWPRGGISLYFRDPDGHLIELATPGVWTVY
ncbi:MAG TPA: VOC family protein [Gemmataceae bacterium]|nr:VOC family protein [Gemmataceae bacterium]